MTLTARVITDSREFAGLEQEWNSLLADVPSATVFQSWEWQSSWIETFQKDLFVLLLSENGNLVAILPFFKVRKTLFSVLKLIGSPDSDYLDLIVRGGCEKQVVAFFLDEFLPKESDIGIVELDSIPETSPNRACLEELREKGQGAGGKGTQNPTPDCSKRAFGITSREKVCPYIELPESWEAYLDSLSSATRYDIKRKERRLEKDFNVSFGYVKEKDELGKRMNDFILQHQKRWRTKQRPGAFAKDSFAVFHGKVAERLFEKGRLRLYYLDLDGKPAASYYLFHERNAFLFYLSGFEPEYGKYSLNTVLLAKAIRDAIGLGLNEFDLMRGEGAYKFKWTDKKRVNRSYSIKRKCAAVFCHSLLAGFVGFAARMVKEKVPYSVKNRIRSIIPNRLVRLLDPYFQE